MRAISMSMCPVKARASASVAFPASARPNRAFTSAGDSSAVNGVSAAWSVAVAPIDLKNARRLSRARI